MFLTAHIWKKGLGRLLVASLAFISLGLASSAYAASETYSWTSAANTTITVSGGSLNKSANLTMVGAVKPDGSAEFAGPITAVCGSATVTGTLTLKVDGNNYKKIYPSLASTSGPVSLTCAKIDNPVSIASDTGSTTSGTATGAASAAPSDCDQGSVSWIMCPAIDKISANISQLATSVLTPLLKVNQITPTTTPEIYQVWQGVRNFTDVLFILVFFMVIFATAFHQDIGPFDQYSVRKIWPRLIFAAVFIQFSFIFCGFLVDIGNVLGAGVTALMTSVVPLSQGASSIDNLANNLLLGGVGLLAGTGAVLVLASWTAAIPLLISLMLSLLAVFLTLGARYIVIGLLIILSPIAILAWVLPNTRKYASDWFKTFFRLILMYPLIVAILSVAGMVNELLPFGHDATTSAAAGIAVSVVTPLITIAAFLLIPFTFKIAGRGVSQMQSFINGTTNRGKGMLKGSEMWEKGADQRKRNQSALMNRVAKSNSITSLKGKGAAGRGAAAVLTFGAGTALLNGPKTSQGVQKAVSANSATAFKQIGELDEATIPMLQKVADLNSADATKRAAARRTLQAEAPNLLRIASTPAGRTAVVKTLADKGMLGANDIGGILNAPKRSFASPSYDPSIEFPQMREAGGKEFGAKPTILARVNKATNDYEIKDALGNVVHRISRDVGDVDTNLLGGLIRNVTASSFGDKHAVENFKLMGKRDDPKATPQEQKAAKEIAAEYAKNLDATIEKSFSPHQKEFTSRGARYEWLKNAQKNVDIFKANGPRALEASISHLERDHDIVDDLIKLTGIKPFELAALNDTGRVNLVRDWMRGEPYDPAYLYSYNSGGKSVPLV